LDALIKVVNRKRIFHGFPVLIFSLLFPAVLFNAQEHTPQNKFFAPPTENSQMNGDSGQKDTIILYIPDFLKFPDHGCFKPFRKLDTIFRFEYYDDRDSIIDTIRNFDEVYYVSLLKKYIDSQHTYRDNHGKDQLLPVEQIIQRYDRTDTDKWQAVDYTKNKFYRLTEDQKTITGEDYFDTLPKVKSIKYTKTTLFP